MAGDLEQRVVWALEQQCSIRAATDPRRPSDVETALAPIVAYEEALREGTAAELLGDVLVTSTRSLNDPFHLGSDRRLSVPETGWCVSSQFSDWGGVEGLFKECGACPSNVRRHRLAGCSGSFYLDPDSVPLNEFLVSTVGDLGLGEEYRRCFEMTNPLWYGLWNRHRLESNAQAVLLVILDHLLEKQGIPSSSSPSDLLELKTFRDGLRLAQEQGVTVHVELSAPRRQVLDLLTVFPHCPACRASALDQPWQRPYPNALQTCSVCGVDYSPSETASSQRMASAESNLYRLLGPDAYRDLSLSFLRRRACSAAESEDLVASVIKTIEEERSFEGHLKSIRDRQRQFLEENIYQGLSVLPPPPSEVIELDSNSVDEQIWFDSNTFKLVLSRVTELGVTIRYMTHIGINQADERHVWENIDDPLALLEEWTKSGCQGKFSALLIVPNSMLGSAQENKNESD